MKRALLIGGCGRLGTAIVRGWSDWHVTAPPHEQLPLDDAQALRVALKSEPFDAVVNCAAFHDVDACEVRPAQALALNALAVEAAARVCKEAGVSFVSISTDYVFDGLASEPYAESDAPHPLNAYGVSKLAGELLLERLEPGVLVVRTCGLYGHPRPASAPSDFVQRVFDSVRQRTTMRVVGDVIASPTYAGHLALALRALLERRCSGLYHAAADGPVTWYDFAAELLRQAGVKTPALEPISATQWKAAARRPRFSALGSAKLATDAGFAMPTWREGVAAYLRDYPAFSLEESATEPVR